MRVAKRINVSVSEVPIPYLCFEISTRSDSKQGRHEQNTDFCEEGIWTLQHSLLADSQGLSGVHFLCLGSSECS